MGNPPRFGIPECVQDGRRKKFLRHTVLYTTSDQLTGGFYPDELNMIEYLARGDTVSFSELADYAPAYVEHLLGYGIVVRRGKDFEFAFDAVREAVTARFESPKKLHLTEKWRETRPCGRI